MMPAEGKRHAGARAAHLPGCPGDGDQSFLRNAEIHPNEYSGLRPGLRVSRAFSGGDPCDLEMYALIRAEHRI